MRKKLLFLSVTIILVTLTTSAFGQKAQRITLGRGATTTIVTGALKGYKDRKVYLLRVRDGQTLSTEQVSSPSSLHYITVGIDSPSGEEISDADASCNNRQEVEQTTKGDYKITVTECRKADAWNGNFRLRITVK